MGEHVWRLFTDYKGGAYCTVHNERDCIMSKEDAEAHLNATERLDAVDARQAANYVTPKHIDIYNALLAYADILEQTCTPDAPPK